VYLGWDGLLGCVPWLGTLSCVPWLGYYWVAYLGLGIIGYTSVRGIPRLCILVGGIVGLRTLGMGELLGPGTLLGHSRTSAFGLLSLVGVDDLVVYFGHDGLLACVPWTGKTIGFCILAMWTIGLRTLAGLKT
jgi:hypothetical protein